MDVKIKLLRRILYRGKNNCVHSNCKIQNCSEKIFIEKKLGDLEDSQKGSKCHQKLRLKVIAFDETLKKLHTGIPNSNRKSSCDAVVFLTKRKDAEIHFIEIKSILNFKNDTKNIKSWEDKVKKIENFKFYKKVADSLQTMNDIIDHKNMCISSNDKEEYLLIPKIPILLVDIDKDTEYEESFTFTLDFLALETELYKVADNKRLNLQPARLAFCGNFDEKYN